ncbi:MAG: alpha/beta hydrolase, partial [Acidobacteria bacterium]|nr:alpha/beta hydrolase [Acidobacteriota bacterium]
YLRTPLQSGRTYRDQAHLFAAFLDSMEISQAVVMGISAGGPAALEFAREHPGKCAGKSGTTLVRKGKAALVPQEVTVHRVQNGLSIVYQFPRTDPITLEDKEVEFISRVGPVEFKRKFKLKEMVYGGKLAL